MNLLREPIEDLANLNLSFALLIDDAFQSDAFTLRVTTGAGVAPIPLPAGAPLLLAGLAMLGFARRRRGSKASLAA